MLMPIIVAVALSLMFFLMFLMFQKMNKKQNELKSQSKIPNDNQIYLANKALAFYGKEKKPFLTLHFVKSAWVKFYTDYPDFDFPKSSPEAWKKYADLLEMLCYRAHFTYYDVDTNKWFIENECGKNSYMEFNPLDYFVFEGE